MPTALFFMTVLVRFFSSPFAEHSLDPPLRWSICQSNVEHPISCRLGVNMDIHVSSTCSLRSQSSGVVQLKSLLMESTFCGPSTSSLCIANFFLSRLDEGCEFDEEYSFTILSQFPCSLQICYGIWFLEKTLRWSLWT